MMARTTILRQIAAGNVERIGEGVSVEYDNRLQTPLSFQRAGRHYEVTECIGAYRERRKGAGTTYLVRTAGQAYALSAELRQRPGGATRGRWELRFRVREPEEEAVLVDFQLKRIADFHGHLCPELVIGYRACLCALPRLRLQLFVAPELRVLAENTTSAVDAIQHLTGCTSGNGRLIVKDRGQHVYTFVNGQGEGLRLALRPNAVLFDPEFLVLEARIQAEQATLAEAARYQVLLDERILTLLHLDEATLFDIRPASAAPRDADLTSALVPCSRCGELTALTHIVFLNGQRVCLACMTHPAANGDD